MSRRDMTPALGTPGAPARWRRAVKGARVSLQSDGWQDGAWSFLFGADTQYATAAPERDEPGPAETEFEFVQGPMMKPAVWTWEIPLYFWLGGMAAGSSFVGLACDVAGDRRAARLARAVAVGAVLPCPVLLIMDLGRPARFLNMLRIFKPRSPMSMGAWCLVAFSGAGTAAVGADLLGKDRTATGLGAANAVLGGYLGSYTGVLLASTAVPLWARSRLFLGPIFVATGVASGAAACRLALVATGRHPQDPTRRALGRVETGAIAVEMILSQVNEARLGALAEPLDSGPSGRWFRAAKWGVRGALALRLGRPRSGSRAHNLASAATMAAALCFRYGWVAAGRASVADDAAVARMARARATMTEPDAPVKITHH